MTPKQCKRSVTLVSRDWTTTGGQSLLHWHAVVMKSQPISIDTLLVTESFCSVEGGIRISIKGIFRFWGPKASAKSLTPTVFFTVDLLQFLIRFASRCLLPSIDIRKLFNCISRDCPSSSDSSLHLLNRKEFTVTKFKSCRICRSNSCAMILVSPNHPLRPTQTSMSMIFIVYL